MRIRGGSSPLVDLEPGLEMEGLQRISPTSTLNSKLLCWTPSAPSEAQVAAYQRQLQ